jgi:hypothetical protein
MTEVLDFYNRHGVFLLRRSTAQAISRRWSPASHCLGQAMRSGTRHPFLWIRWLHVSVIQSVWGLLEDKMALGHPRSLNNSDFPCRYNSLAFHMRSVMEKGALMQVSVWVVWPSADCLSFSPLEICGELRGAMTNFSPCTPVVLCRCFLCFADRASRYNSCKWPTWRTVLFSYMFIPNLYMFRALMCSSSGELIVSVHLVYVTLCRWPSGMQVWVELMSSHVPCRSTAVSYFTLKFRTVKWEEMLQHV